MWLGLWGEALRKTPILESEGTGQAEMGSGNNASIAAYAIDGAIPRVDDYTLTWITSGLPAIRPKADGLICFRLGGPVRTPKWRSFRRARRAVSIVKLAHAHLAGREPEIAHAPDGRLRIRRDPENDPEPHLSRGRHLRRQWQNRRGLKKRSPAHNAHLRDSIRLLHRVAGGSEPVMLAGGD